MPDNTLRISLITPTYNECENISLLVEEIFDILKDHSDIDLELIVVDDNSPDGTGEVAESLVDRYPVQVVHRAGKLGLGSAVMAGFERAERDLLGVMDADLSHDPIVLPQLIYGLRNHDLAIGSRFDSESRVEQWAWYRRIISQLGVFLARQLTGVQDPLAGYFFLHRRVIEDMVLTSPGYKILLEILVKGHYESFIEVPFVFRNRQHSSSKLNWTEYYLFLKQLLTFYFLKKKTSANKINKSGILA